MYNIAGVTLPSIAGILTVPVLLDNLGPERVGIFSLAMGVIGFAGVFDLGIGRALTQSVASAVGAGSNSDALSKHIRKALLVVFIVGAAWGLGLWNFADALVRSVFNLDNPLAREAVNGISWLALALPCLLLSSSLIGVLEGLQRFALVNLWRVPLGILAFIVPAISSFFSQDVGIVIGSLVIARLAGLLVWVWAAPRAVAEHRGGNGWYDGRSMWRFASWLTVSNVVGPLMVHADRFYLASLFPPASIAYYTVPLDTLFRTTSLPVAGMNAVFPALAQSGRHSAEARSMLRGAAWFTFIFWALPLICVGLLLEWLLVIWLGQEFAGQSLVVAEWILLGVLMNGFAHIPYALLQSAGRADITAKIHLFELPIYACALYALVSLFGLPGAAIAWTSRVALDTGLLYWVGSANFSYSDGALRTAAVLALLSAAAFSALIIV